MSLYTLAKTILRNANVKNDDDFKVLTDFKECLLHKFRNNRNVASDLRASMKDDLLKGLSSRYLNELPPSKEDWISSYLICDACGYMLKTRSCLYMLTAKSVNSLLSPLKMTFLKNLKPANTPELALKVDFSSSHPFLNAIRSWKGSVGTFQVS